MANAYSSSFYDPLGLRELALWLDELIEVRKQFTQTAIADCAGVSQSTINSLRSHRFNRAGEMVSRKPEPDLILSLANCIPDPQTGEPFKDPWRLIRVVNGVESLRDPEPEPARTAERSSKYKVEGHPYPAAAREIKRLMGKRSVEQAATDWGIDPNRLQDFLTATDESRAVPNVLEIQKIVKASYPDKLMNRLWQFYEEPQKVNGKSSQ